MKNKYFSTIEQKNQLLHRIACFIGGFTGCHIILRTGIFASAQTLNLLNIVINALSGNIPSVLKLFGAMSIYILGILTCLFLKIKMPSTVKTVSLTIIIIGIFSYIFMPISVPGDIQIYPSFFMMSFMWVAFGESIKGYNSSCIFSTNNLRQAVYELGAYTLEKDKKHLDKGLFFLGSLVFFHSGAIVSYISTTLLGKDGIIVCLIPVLLALYINNINPQFSCETLKSS